MGIKTGGANLDLDPPAGPDVLRGLWFAEGGGHAVELSPDGSYTMAGDYGEVVDRARGRWTARTAVSRSAGGRLTTRRQGDRYALGRSDWKKRRPGS